MILHICLGLSAILISTALSIALIVSVAGKYGAFDKEK